jgi:AcrR family transcriptional regulator
MVSGRARLPRLGPETSELADRRRELFTLAAPVFRRDGYHGATIKALAHACHLSPAGLYHYFPSKLALATYLLQPQQRTGDYADVIVPTGSPEELVAMIALTVCSLDEYMLALDLGREIGLPEATSDRARVSREGIVAFERVLRRCAPGMSAAEASETAHVMLAILVEPYATGLVQPTAVVEHRLLDVIAERTAGRGLDLDALAAARLGNRQSA